MRLSHRLALATGVLILLAGCSSNATDDKEATGPAGSDTTTTSEPAPAVAVTALQGRWTTDLRRTSVVAYMRKAGWSEQAQRALLAPSMSGPKETEFRIDFVGNRFRMSQSATDEQWQSGTFELRDNGSIWLDDEAPVGYLTFRYHLGGDHLTFDQPGSQPPGMPEFMPGVPDWAPGALMWATESWHHDGNQ